MRVHESYEHEALSACGRCLGRRGCVCRADKRTRKRAEHSHADVECQPVSYGLAVEIAVAASNRDGDIYADAVTDRADTEAAAQLDAAADADDATVTGIASRRRVNEKGIANLDS